AQLRNGEVYNIDRLTDNDGTFPRWSPDGHSIAFLSVRNGWLNLFVIGMDGTNQRRLSNDNVADSLISGDFVSWSPDGEEIAFTSYSPLSVVVVDVASARILQTFDRAQWASWSPDGEQIVFGMYDIGGVWTVHLAPAED